MKIKNFEPTEITDSDAFSISHMLYLYKGEEYTNLHELIQTMESDFGGFPFTFVEFGIPYYDPETQTLEEYAKILYFWFRSIFPMLVGNNQLIITVKTWNKGNGHILQNMPHVGKLPDTLEAREFLNSKTYSMPYESHYKSFNDGWLSTANDWIVDFYGNFERAHGMASSAEKWFKHEQDKAWLIFYGSINPFNGDDTNVDVTMQEVFNRFDKWEQKDTDIKTVERIKKECMVDRGIRIRDLPKEEPKINEENNSESQPS